MTCECGKMIWPAETVSIQGRDGRVHRLDPHGRCDEAIDSETEPKVTVRILLTGTLEWPIGRAEEWIAEFNKDDEHAWFNAFDALGNAKDPTVVCAKVGSALRPSSIPLDMIRLFRVQRAAKGDS